MIPPPVVTPGPASRPFSVIAKVLVRLAAYQNLRDHERTRGARGRVRLPGRRGGAVGRTPRTEGWPDATMSRAGKALELSWRSIHRAGRLGNSSPGSRSDSLHGREAGCCQVPPGQSGPCPAQPFPGEVWAQAALPIQGAVVVAATRYLAIGSERAEAGEFVLVVPLEYSIV